MEKECKVAIAVAEKDFEKAEHLISQLRWDPDEVVELEDPDGVYKVWYWDYAVWDDDSEEETALLRFLETVRHARIVISDDGMIFKDISIADADGCDEVFEDLISWRADIYTDHFCRHTFGSGPVWIYSVTAYNDDLPEGLIACSAAFSEEEAREVTRRWIRELDDPDLVRTLTFKLRAFMTGATGFDLNSFCDAVEIDPFEDDLF